MCVVLCYPEPILFTLLFRNNGEADYLAGHRLSIVEQVVFLHLPIFCLELSCLSVLRIIQQHIDLTHRPEQTSKETLEMQSRLVK